MTSECRKIDSPPSLLSIVMPVFNEERTVGATVESCATDVGAKFGRFEIIVVDDDSADGTGAALDALQRTVPELRVLTNSSNLGHGAALQRGLGEARGDFVFVIDSDFQHEPADFWRLYEAASGSAIVIGCRDVRVDAWYRRWASATGNVLIGLLVGGGIGDINVPFKLFPGTVLGSLLPTLPERALIPSTLLMVGAVRSGIPVRQVPVAQLPRRYGSSSLPGTRFVVFCARALAELLRYRARLPHRQAALTASPAGAGRGRPESLLALRGIKKSLGGRQVLDGVDVRVRPGEIVVLLGPNGAGKTTLLGAACGRIRPDSGSVLVCGGDPRTQPEARRHLGLVPQGLALYPYLSVRENLQIIGRMMGVAKPVLGARVEWALDWSGLGGYADDRVETLSGGMRRRLNIVASLLHEPGLLLLDEPTVGVDVNARQRIHELLEGLRENGIGMLITTHDLDQAEALADRVIFMVAGTVRVQGAPGELVYSNYGSSRELVVKLGREAGPEHSGALSARGLTPLRGGRTWVGAVDAGFTDAAGWTRDLDELGLDIAEIRVKEPDLEGVFLRVTGEELQL